MLLFSGNHGDTASSPSCKRKSDILNKAQEFVDLKKQFDDVLPYNAHKATPLSDRYLRLCIRFGGGGLVLSIFIIF